jgi:hypothetical protein
VPSSLSPPKGEFIERTCGKLVARPIAIARDQDTYVQKLNSAFPFVKKARAVRVFWAAHWVGEFASEDGLFSPGTPPGTPSEN